MGLLNIFIFFVFSRLIPKNQRGATLVEYALILGLIAIVSIAILGVLGGSVHDLFSEVNDKLPK